MKTDIFSDVERLLSFPEISESIKIQEQNE
jgi:hypothetical protein